MLLSSDWFIPAWSICGLSSPVVVRQKIKECCRKIVSNIMIGEESYWDVEFSDERKRATDDCLVKCLIECRAAPHDIEVIRRLVGDGAGGAESKYDQVLASTLFSLLASEYSRNIDMQEGLSPKIFSVVSSSIDSAGGIEEVKLLAKQAVSDWDMWLGNVTKDVPRFFINVAQDICDATDGFSKSWAVINDRLSIDEQEMLVAWLNKWGLLLAGKVVVTQ